MTGGRLIRVYIILTIIPLPRKVYVPSSIPKGMPRTVEMITDKNDTYSDSPTISKISGSPAKISLMASIIHCPIVSIYTCL